MSPNNYDDEELIDDGPGPKPPPSGSPSASVGQKPPADSVAKSTKPAVDPAAPVQENLTWGLVGSRNFRAALSGDWEDEGVVRIVEAGVTYTPPPKETGLREWRQVPNNPARFEMAWAINPANLLTLEALGRDLGKTPPTSLADARLAELDEAVAALLTIACRLHEAQRGLGLLNPRNILIVPDKGGKDLVLADFGFTWKRTSFKPAWLETADFKPLWDRDPEAQQHVGSGGEGGAPFDAVSDVRTLARLFACVLTGHAVAIVKDVPPDDARSKTKNPDALKRVWATLAQAGRGEFKTVVEFQAKLAESPLSQHVFASPPPPRVSHPGGASTSTTEGGGPRLPIVLSGVAAALVLVLVVLLVWKPWQRDDAGKRNGGDPNKLQPKDTSAFEKLNAKFGAAGPDAQAALLREMYQDDALSTDAELRRQEESLREALRKDFLQKNWMPRFRKAEQLSQDLAQRFVSGKQVETLHNELKKLQERPAADPQINHEEKECLDFSERRARELGSAP